MMNSGLWSYIKNIKFNSMIIRNFLIILFLILIPFSGISYFYYNDTENIITHEINIVNTSSLNRIKDTIDSVVKETDQLATKISLQPSVVSFAVSDRPEAMIKDSFGNNNMLEIPKSSSIFDQMNLYDKIMDTISMFTNVYSYINSVYIYSEKSNYIIANREGGKLEKFSDKSWYDLYKQRKNTERWLQYRKKNDIYPYLISVARPIYLKQNEILGVVIINIDVEELGKIIANTNDANSQHIYIVDADQTIVYSSKKEELGSSARENNLLKDMGEKVNYKRKISVNGKESIISQVYSDYTGWKYISLLSIQSYGERMRQMRNIVINIIVLCFVIVTILSFMISVKMYQPVKNIISVIKFPEQWNENNKKSKHESELRYIYNMIIQVFKSKQQLELELQQRLYLLNKTQIATLQAQINPHFLYNTLETINWMAVKLTNGQNEVSQTLLTLSKLFRVCVEVEDYLISVEEEINNAQTYITILKLRYKDKFTVIWNINENIKKCKIIKICFQPLIENAIYHGIKPKRKNGIIRINGTIQEGDIIIEVIDDGIGMTQQKVEYLNQNLSRKYETKSGHIGIRNVDQRIKLIFGNKYGIAVSSMEGEGTNIKLTMPQIEDTSEVK